MRFFIIFLFLSFQAFPQLKIAHVFTDNMVLQREKPIHFWGTGKPNKTINISLGNVKSTIIIKNDSTWSIKLPAQKANAESQTLIISSETQEIVLHDILIRDIWLCTGQSNMEFPLIKEKHIKEEIFHTNIPQIRFLNPDYIGKNRYGAAYSDAMIKKLSDNNLYEKASWQVCDSNTAKFMSAVAYYFGKELYNNTKIPIGLINLSIGGSPIETWIEESALKDDIHFAGKVNANWLSNNQLPIWTRKRGMENIGNIISEDESKSNHAFKPGFVFHTGIQPIVAFPVKGVIFYQGESNAQEDERVNEYNNLFKLMVNNYRTKWNQPSLPFYYVQLSSIDTLNYKSQLWRQFRDNQRRLLDEIKNTGMAVCTDIGAKNDVHPTNKKDIGIRLAKWALNNTYHINLLASGPLPEKAIQKNGQIIISFKYTGKKLIIPPKESIKGFSIDGNESINPSISGNKIIIPFKSKAKYVYYGWKPYTEGNLMNIENLPTSTFKLKIEQQ